MNKHVLKTSHQVELFSPQKYSHSIGRTLQATGMAKAKQSALVETMGDKMHAWLKNKSEVSSKDIFVFTHKELALHSKEAATIYKNYREIW